MNQFSFSIPQHINNLLCEALSDNEFGDTLLLSDSKSLKCGGGIRVHSIVLTQCFPNIAKLLQDSVTDMGEHLRRVTVMGAGEEELRDVMRLVYTGAIRVTESRMGEVMAVANMLGLQNIEILSESGNPNSIISLEEDDNVDNHSMDEETAMDVPEGKHEDISKPEEPQVIKITKKDTEKLDLNDIRTRTCEACGKVYKARHVMLKHFRFYHTGEAGKERRQKDLNTPRTCTECGKQFKTQSAYANHFKAHHTNSKYHCDKCDFSTSIKINMTRHKINKHEAHRFCCDKCSATYPNKYLLDVHIRSDHEGILIKCSECDYSAKHKHHVYKHYRSVHQKK